MSTLKNELESEVSSPRSQPNLESLLQKLSIKVILSLPRLYVQLRLCWTKISFNLLTKNTNK